MKKIVKFLRENKYILISVVMFITYLIINKSYFLSMIVFPLSIILSIIIDKYYQFTFINKLSNSVDKSNIESKKSELNYNNFFSLSNDLMCIMDKNFKFIKASNSFSNILGWGIDDFSNINFKDLILKDDLIKIKNLSKNLPTNNLVLRMKNKNGEYFTLIWNITFTDGFYYLVGKNTNLKIENEKNQI